MYLRDASEQEHDIDTDVAAERAHNEEQTKPVPAQFSRKLVNVARVVVLSFWIDRYAYLGAAGGVKAEPC